jgi:hypothetical protein
MTVVRIIKEIELGLDQLRKLRLEYAEVPDNLRPNARNRIKGSIFHDFYSGLEKIFRRIAAELNGGVPRSDTWHRDLLLEMTWEIEGVRPPVLTGPTQERLVDFLRFRHVFRNLYGFELESAKLDELDRTYLEVLDAAVGEIQTFVEWLRSAV